jgi:hypothetical protein
MDSLPRRRQRRPVQQSAGLKAETPARPTTSVPPQMACRHGLTFLSCPLMLDRLDDGSPVGDLARPPRHSPDRDVKTPAPSIRRCGRSAFCSAVARPRLRVGHWGQLGRGRPVGNSAAKTAPNGALRRAEVCCRLLQSTTF